MYVHTRSARRAQRQAPRHPPSSRAAAAKSPFGRTGFEDCGGGSRISKFAPWRAANSDPSLASSVGRNAKNAPLARFCPAGRVSTSSVRVPPLGLTGKYKKAGSLPNLRVYRGGDGGTRTPDPYVANVMLYQLSYIPMGTVFVRRLFCASLGCLSN